MKKLLFLAFMPLAGCSAGAPDPTAKVRPILLIDIVDQFADEPVVALRRYEDGIFDIDASIDSIEPLGDRAELFLSGGSGVIAQVNFADPDAAQDALAQFDEGDFVVVRCAQVRVKGKNVYDLNRCGPPRHPNGPPA